MYDGYKVCIHTLQARVCFSPVLSHMAMRGTGAATWCDARSLEEKEKVAEELLPSGGGAAAMAATGSTQAMRATPSQAGLKPLSSHPEKCPCTPMHCPSHCDACRQICRAEIK